MKEIIEEVVQERERQNKKWGEQNHNAVEWVAILTEEVGEVAKEAVDFHFNNSAKGFFEHELDALPEKGLLQRKRINSYRKECIQVAAVAIQMVESLDRQIGKAPEKPLKGLSKLDNYVDLREAYDERSARLFAIIGSDLMKPYREANEGGNIFDTIEAALRDLYKQSTQS